MPIWQIDLAHCTMSRNRGEKSMKKSGTVESKLGGNIRIFLCAVLVPVITLFVIELLNQQGIVEVIRWAAAQPMAFLWNLLFAGLCFWGIWLMIGRAFVATLIYSGISLAIGIVNHYMYVLRAEVLLPNDVLNYRAAMSIVPNLTIWVTWQAVVAVLITGAMAFGVFKIKVPKLRLHRLWIRLIAGILVICCVFGMIIETWGRRSLLNRVLDEHPGSQAASVVQYRKYGFNMATAVNLRTLLVEKPYLYSKRLVNRLAEFDNYSYEAADVDVLPNIIVVMGEAWADSRLLNKNIAFLEDPFEPLDTVKTGTILEGDLLVSVYGGNTCNTEFEFLTGSSMAHLPLGSIPYQHYLKKDRVYGLADVLKQLGYQTTAVHSYEGDFWHRDEVYPKMGFDAFYAMDTFEDPQLKYQYISDEDVYKKIVEVYENSNHEQPFFCFSVTMQNHGTYRGEDFFRDYPLEVSEEIDGVELNELKTHTAGVKDTAQLVRDLIDYFDATGKPTLIIGFGDHHPRLAVEPDSAGSPGAPEDEAEYEIKKYSTPLYMWNNYGVEFEPYKLMGSSFLASNLLKYAGIEAPDYFKLNYEANQLIDGFNPFVMRDAEGNALLNPTKVSAPLLSEAIKNLKLMQYDMVFGGQYAADAMYAVPEQNFAPNDIWG